MTSAGDWDVVREAEGVGQAQDEGRGRSAVKEVQVEDLVDMERLHRGWREEKAVGSGAC